MAVILPLAPPALPRPRLAIEAEDHRFGGTEQDLNQRLMDAIAWTRARH